MYCNVGQHTSWMQHMCSAGISYCCCEVIESTIIILAAINCSVITSVAVCHSPACNSIHVPYTLLYIATFLDHFPFAYLLLADTPYSYIVIAIFSVFLLAFLQFLLVRLELVQPHMASQRRTCVDCWGIPRLILLPSSPGALPVAQSLLSIHISLFAKLMQWIWILLLLYAYNCAANYV